MPSESEPGQTEKNSVRAYVFRFAIKLGHRPARSGCLKGARSGRSTRGCCRQTTKTHLRTAAVRVSHPLRDELRHRARTGGARQLFSAHPRATWSG